MTDFIDKFRDEAWDDLMEQLRKSADKLTFFHSPHKRNWWYEWICSKEKEEK